jgi:aspartyl-tRNA(Asn)/glutamyl-tRNA(Gln) amidotransferase subunit A
MPAHRDRWRRFDPNSVRRQRRLWNQPTFGVVPAFPLSPFGTIAHIGPIAANVADAARALAVISGPDHRDWYALPERSWDFSSELDRGIAGLRIALSPTLGYVDVHPEVRELVEAAGKMLAQLGAHVELRDPGFANPFDHFRTIWFAGAANLRRGIPAEKRHLLDPGFNVIADQGEAIGHMDYVGALDARGALGHHMSVFHQDYDLLITPTLPIPAFEAGRLAPAGGDQTNWMDWTPFSYPFNLTQQPAASIPCGFTSSSLPVGLHIVAPNIATTSCCAEPKHTRRAYDQAPEYRRAKILKFNSSFSSAVFDGAAWTAK